MPVTDEATDGVLMVEHCFAPTIVRIPVGNSVTWTNKDADVQVVAGANGSWGSYDEVRSGTTATFRFTKAGVYPYFCFLHIGMIGAVVVGDGGAASGASEAVVAVAPSPTPTPATDARGQDVGRAETTPSSGTSAAWKSGALAGFALFVGATIALLGQRRARNVRSVGL